MLFCHIDSKVEGRKHPDLRREKKLQGLPSLAFLDQEGRVLIKVPHRQRTIPGLRKAADRAVEYLRLRTQSAGADAKPRAKALFLRMQLQERQLPLAEAMRARKGLEVDKALLAELDLLILHLSIQDRLRRVGQKGRADLGPAFWKMWTEGPKPGPRVGRGFWYAILEWAERDRKVDVFAKALESFRASLGVTDPEASWVPGLLQRYQTKLAALRKS